MNKNDRENFVKTSDNQSILDFIIFLVLPLALLIKESGKKSAGNSKSWLRATSGLWSKLPILIICFFLIVLSYILIVSAISQRNLKTLFFAFIFLNISQIPIIRIYWLFVMNKQIKLDIRGGIEPSFSKLISEARIKFSFEQADKKYRSLVLRNDNPDGFIGSRVIPSRIELPYFGSPEVSNDELEKVMDSERAIFPLNPNSPDHHLVIGQSGSGKTTLIKRMILSSIKSGWRVILIDLKGDPEDANSFLNLVNDQSKVRHFPSNAFNFWNGTKSEIAERIISFFPSDSEPYYLARNSSAIQAVVTRCTLDSPKSVGELVERLRNGIKYSSNPDDVRFFSTKERGLPIGDLIANDVSMNLDAIRNIEDQTPFRFGWGDVWDLSVFTLDGFKPSSLKLADALLNDFASWMFSEERARNKAPILLVIDEASAFSRMPQVPILTALIQRARSAQVSLVYASQNSSAFGSDMKNIIHSGAIRWLGVSTEVEEMIGATGTTTVIESGFQYDSDGYTGVISHRNQKEFKIDPDRVKELPTFHWFVSSRGKVSSVFVPPLDY